MNGRRALSMSLIAGVVGCASHRSCSPDLDFDFSDLDECTPAGGTCTLFCEGNSTASDLNCAGLLGVCCKPGPSNGAHGGPIDGSPPTTFREGQCNGESCMAGCLCRPDRSDPAICKTTCDCAKHADGGGHGDAATVDSGDEAGDASDVDAGADAEAGVAPPPAPPQSCGLITCAAECHCMSPSLSVCQCTSSTCPR